MLAQKNPQGVAFQPTEYPSFAHVDDLIHAATEQLEHDHASFQEATRSVRAGESAVQRLNQTAATLRQEGGSRTALLASAETRSRGIDDDLRDLGIRLGRAHEDWAKIDSLADRLTQDAADLAAQLDSALSQARDAARAISAAAQHVRSASGWQGRHRVSIGGAYGQEDLRAAQALLEAGDFLAAQRRAAEGAREAQRAIDAAEARVAAIEYEIEQERRRVAEERRREAERAEAARRAAQDAADAAERAREEASRRASAWEDRSSVARDVFNTDSSGVARDTW